MTFNFGTDSPDEGTKVSWSKAEISQMHQVAKGLNLTWRTSRNNDRIEFMTKLMQSSLIKGSRFKSSLACQIFLFLLLTITTKLDSPVKINVISNIPSGLSLGSSAAFASSLVSVLLMKERIYMCNRKLISKSSLKCDLCKIAHFCPEQKNFINSWVYQAERLAHGKTLGIDNAVSVYGSGRNERAA